MIVKKFLMAAICLILSNNIQPSPIYTEKSIDHTKETIVAVIDSKVNTDHEYISNRCLDGKSFIFQESNTEGHGRLEGPLQPEVLPLGKGKQGDS